MQEGSKQTQINNDKQYFAGIALSERPAWTRKMLQIPQKQGEYRLYKMDYPNSGKWTYKNVDYHYNYKLSQIQPARAVLFYFPGMNAHSGGSAYMAINATKGYPVDIYGLDFKNFGRSGGDQRGYIESEDSLLEQAEQFVSYIMGQQKQKKKVFISGLSMGGAVCFRLAIRHPERYDGIIFLSPALRENKQSQPFMKKIGKFIGSWFPTVKLTNQVFTSMTKFNQTDRILADPYLYKDRVIPGSVKVVLDMMEGIQKQYNKLTTPFLIIQSGVDKMTDPFLAIDLQKQSKSEDKTVVYFKDMWHAVTLQDELPQVIEIISSWLGSRIGK